jgi:cellulose synthase/poly-beta-1,6-N-acetylglucosamine synthase-like glycosyltransferase
MGLLDTALDIRRADPFARGRRQSVRGRSASTRMTRLAAELDRRRTAISPRYAPPPTPLRAVVIHGSVTLLWILLFARAFGESGVFAWSVGLAYVGYDTVLIAFVFAQTLPLLRRPSLPRPAQRPSLGVIVAARNEAAVLPVTLAALLAQTDPADAVVIADDGSDDDTASVLLREYGLAMPPVGAMSAPSPRHPSLRWLRLPHGGKARALNAAMPCIETELVLTVDSDTLLEPDAVAAMRDAFARDAGLVAATGVLFPVCGPTVSGRFFQWFQTYEYMRNFLSRYAWGRQDGLLLISGAFAAYRRQAVLDVGGFDLDCLVEDYELTHRLRDYAVRQGLRWRTAVVGGARARTDAPATIGAFLRQRRRWFGGFLQTQLWYRHMVGNPRYGRLGTLMLPVKAFDTMQPLYGLTSVALLLGALVADRSSVVAPVAGVIAAKIALDLAFYLWSLLLYRRWLGDLARVNVAWAIVAALIEPFTFQIVRHSGAALGWVSFITGERRWGLQARTALAGQSRPMPGALQPDPK